VCYQPVKSSRKSYRTHIAHSSHRSDVNQVDEFIKQYKTSGHTAIKHKRTLSLTSNLWLKAFLASNIKWEGGKVMTTSSTMLGWALAGTGKRGTCHT